MGKLLIVCALALVLVISPAGANPGDDQWKPMIQDGFGDAQTIGVEELEAVGEAVFAATRRQAGSGAAGIFVTTDDGASWQQSSFAPSLPATTNAVPMLASASDGALFAGTADANGGGVYAFDGSSFTPVPGWLPRNGVSISPGAFVSPTHVFFGTERDEGGELWRLDRATGAFERLLDFASINPTIDLVGAISEFRGVLYAGTRTPGRNRTALWSSTTGAPGSWRVVPASRRGFQAAGAYSAETSRHVGIAMATYRGRLYVAVDNPRAGGAVLRTKNGRDWQVVAVAGVDAPPNRALVGFQSFEGSLWMASVARRPPGASVFEANADEFGFGFAEMNVPGFGDAATRGGSPDLAMLNDALWWGGANTRTGAQVWRLSAEDLNRATATGPGVTIADDPTRLTSDGRFAIRVTCPADDPYGCHGGLEIRTAERFRVEGRRRRVLLAGRIFEMNEGVTRTFSFRLRGSRLRFVRARLPVRLDVRSIAFDNAYDSRAAVALTR